jgi:hypothetical protein
MLIDFDDDRPAMVSNVKHLPHSVRFDARGTQFRLDKFEQLVVVLRMEVV